MSEFCYQWRNIPSHKIEFNQNRVNEFLRVTGISGTWFKNKRCLDAGCGNGRYTYAMQRLGAKVTSYDMSEEGVKSCLRINPDTFIIDISSIPYSDKLATYDFVFSFGVLHHIKDTYDAFKRVSQYVRPGGVFHVMLYHEKTQEQYKEHRKIFRQLDIEKKKDYIEKIRKGSDFHGWWDALIPEYNNGFTVPKVKEMFEKEGYKDIRVVSEFNININATKK